MRKLVRHQESAVGGIGSMVKVVFLRLCCAHSFDSMHVVALIITGSSKCTHTPTFWLLVEMLVMMLFMYVQEKSTFAHCMVKRSLFSPVGWRG